MNVQFLAWHQAARHYVGEHPIGNPIIAHEFPYDRTNQMVYDKSGVKTFSNIAVRWGRLLITLSGMGSSSPSQVMALLTFMQIFLSQS